jgi:hypothetical protein
LVTATEQLKNRRESMVGIMLSESGYSFLTTHVTEAPAGWSYIPAISTYVRNQVTVFSIHGFVAGTANANYLRDLVSEEALTTSIPPYAFVDRIDFIFILIFDVITSLVSL